MKLVKGIHIKQAVLDVPPRQIIAMTLVQWTCQIKNIIHVRIVSKRHGMTAASTYTKLLCCTIGLGSMMQKWMSGLLLRSLIDGLEQLLLRLLGKTQ
jgi:hypothetical protein